MLYIKKSEPQRGTEKKCNNANFVNLLTKPLFFLFEAEQEPFVGVLIVLRDCIQKSRKAKDNPDNRMQHSTLAQAQEPVRQTDREEREQGIKIHQHSRHKLTQGIPPLHLVKPSHQVNQKE